MTNKAQLFGADQHAEASGNFQTAVNGNFSSKLFVDNDPSDAGVQSCLDNGGLTGVQGQCSVIGDKNLLRRNFQLIAQAMESDEFLATGATSREFVPYRAGNDDFAIERDENFDGLAGCYERYDGPRVDDGS